MSAALPRLVIEGAARAGGDASRVARRLGVDLASLSSPEARVPLERERCLWPEAARAVDDGLFGARLGASPVPGRLEVFDYVWRNAPTVGEALGCVARYLPLLHDVAELRVSEQGERVVLDFSFRGEAVPLERHMAEFTFASIISSIERATGSRLAAPALVTFHHRPPDQFRELARILSTDHIEFRAPVCSLSLPRTVMARPLLHADTSLGAILRRHADMLLARCVRPAGLREQITHVVLRQEGSCAPTLDQVARALHLGARTLQRRLAAESLNFHEVVDEARREAATELLLEGVTVSEIARRLQYSDVRALRRAFIRWTGQTPQEYRARHAPGRSRRPPGNHPRR